MVRCCICGDVAGEYGHDPDPVTVRLDGSDPDPDDRCCDGCNTTLVVPTRTARSAGMVLRLKFGIPEKSDEGDFLMFIPKASLTVIGEAPDDVKPTLGEAQALVGGLVQLLRVPFYRCVDYLQDQVEAEDPEELQLLFDEEGRWKDENELNLPASSIAGQPILGNAVLLRGPAMWT